MTATLWTPPDIKPRPESNFRWATIATVLPLTIRLDGDSEPMAGTPDTLEDLGNLKPGDRVWCQLYNRRVVVLGRSGAAFSSGAKTGSLLQTVMSGGGVRGVSSTGVNWSQRFILMGAGISDLVPNGYFNIDMPPDGTVIPIHSGAADSTTVAAGTIPMINWQALYYDVPYGIVTSASQPGNFHIVYYTGGDDFQVPPNWVLIAVRNGDTRAAAYKWGDGRAQDYWHTLTLQNSWVAYGSGWAVPAYRIGNDGRVILHGLMKSGTVGGVPAMTFSTDLAPEGGASGTGVLVMQPASGGVARVDVKQDGQLWVQSLVSPATNAFVSLDGLSWFPNGA